MIMFTDGGYTTRKFVKFDLGLVFHSSAIAFLPNLHDESSMRYFAPRNFETSPRCVPTRKFSDHLGRVAGSIRRCCCNVVAAHRASGEV